MGDSFKNSYTVEEREIVSLSVVNVGFQKCEPLYQWGTGIRDHHILHHIVSGKGVFRTNGKTYHLNAGDTFLIYPYTEITYYADKQAPWEYYWVGFSGSDAALILQSTDFTFEKPVVFQSNYSEEIKGYVLSIYDSRGNDFTHAVEMTGRLYILLSLFLREASKPKRRKDSYMEYTRKGVEYIVNHYSYAITVDNIARYVGISRSHLYRAFQQYTKMSPKEYLSAFRIKQACSLLKKSELSISAIAASVGYENNLYFSKAFKKAKGISPTDYLKKHKN